MEAEHGHVWRILNTHLIFQGSFSTSASLSSWDGLTAFTCCFLGNLTSWCTKRRFGKWTPRCRSHELEFMEGSSALASQFSSILLLPRYIAFSLPTTRSWMGFQDLDMHGRIDSWIDGIDGFPHDFCWSETLHLGCEFHAHRHQQLRHCFLASVFAAACLGSCHASTIDLQLWSVDRIMNRRDSDTFQLNLFLVFVTRKVVEFPPEEFQYIEVRSLITRDLSSAFQLHSNYQEGLINPMWLWTFTLPTAFFAAKSRFGIDSP